MLKWEDVYETLKTFNFFLFLADRRWWKVAGHVFPSLPIHLWVNLKCFCFWWVGSSVLSIQFVPESFTFSPNLLPLAVQFLSKHMASWFSFIVSGISLSFLYLCYWCVYSWHFFLCFWEKNGVKVAPSRLWSCLSFCSHSAWEIWVSSGKGRK